ncbi:TetR family transcriptional regulator [Actinocorallia sp. API 0066]|uniref:TetR/AcrR family transcriptional regulator n=1 Tax=Actinocorallia sp. API 0066 TaxID=2896846 RepID=UPI001E43051E|nr:TetR family transcriptional regulator [Actinocorallia sp. API 0066]MCD0450923.1 TetR family transcriptional regulator [Actinocorallia sp. API 0066]
MNYDAEATRRRIFQAATAEFAAHGLAGARVERIAASAKANKQAIYLYFGNKEELFGAVLRAKLDEACGSGVLDLADPVTSAGQLFDWYREHPELVRLLLWEALENGPGRVQGEEERRATYRHSVCALLGPDAPEDADRAARDAMFTLLGLVAWNFAVPQLRRLILDEEDDEAALARRRAAVVRTVAALPRTVEAAEPAEAG